MGELGWQLKEKAAEMGLGPIGITTADSLNEARDILNQISSNGQNIPFVAGDILRRTTPKLVWPRAKSIIMVGLPFDVSASGPSFGTTRGYFSAGSFPMDYHTVLRRKLSDLATFLGQLVSGAWSASFVDNGPFIERALAHRAGVGVRGQNSFIMRPTLGQAFFLGGLITDVKLPTDTPLLNTCLECGRCRNACPTGALHTPYQLDYRLCLSYWTQSKKTIPVRFRSLLKNRLYGCDSCLRACPLIKKSPQNGATVDLFHVLTLGNQQFNLLYRATGFAWRGRTVLQRNAALALGNSGQTSAIPSLIALLNDNRAPLRIAAAWSLGKLDIDVSRHALRQRLQHESEPEVCAEIRQTLLAN